MATFDKNAVKAAASGRWREVLSVVGGIDLAVLDGKNHPCPRCGGKDAFRVMNKAAGAVSCSECFSEQNGDGISAVRWMHGCSFPGALSRIADYLGLEANSNGRADDSDIVELIARLNRVPVESLKAFGAHRAKRGKLTVCRIPMYGPDGSLCAYFDLANWDEKWLRGYGQKGKPAGVFLAGGMRPAENETVLLCEGVKDAAVLHSLGYQAAGLPTHKMAAKFMQLFVGCHSIIIPARDMHREDGARMTAARVAGVAASVRIATLPGELKQQRGDDVRDVLAQQNGEALLRQAIEDAATWTPDATDIEGRVCIEVTPDQHVVIEQAINALASDEMLYKRSGSLVHVVRERTDTEEEGIERSAGTPRIRSVSRGLLRERLSAQCWFFKISTGEDGGERQCPPPGFVVSAIHDRGFWEPLRMLSGITETPLLRADGTILSTPGCDEQTGLRYEPGGDVPEIPTNPDLAAAISAAELLSELVQDFPFAADAHCAAWLAALLTALGRRAFHGPSPLFLVDANVRGSGKSLLTDVIAIIVSGREMPRFSNPRDDEEARKRITSLALAGDPLVLIDNIGSTLGSASLDAALTSTTWKDRLLGVNTIVECPLRPLWMATGNNVILIGDTPRRVCHIRLESPLEAPEERDDFRCPNLLAYVREHRLPLLTAGLTILRAFVVAGRPDARLKPWGSFDGWSGLIRNAVVWLGLPDPGLTRKELVEASDRDAAALRSLLSGWEELDPAGEGLTAAEVCKRLEAAPNSYDGVRSALMELCDGKVKGLTGRQVGNQLRRFKGRVVGDRRLELLPGGHRKINRWRVAAVCAVSAASFSHPLAREAEPLSGGETEGQEFFEQGQTHPAHTADTAGRDSACHLSQCVVCHFEDSVTCEREDCPTFNDNG